MKIQTIIIQGKPIAKARPRFVRRGKFVGIYSDQQTEEGRFMWEVTNRWKGEPFEGVMQVKLLFYMPIPKSISKKKRENIIFHYKKPDIDNLIKFVMDCLNGIVWKDDSQIAWLSAGKLYDDNPRTEIIIGEL